jgi:hypothetical protein
MFSCVFPFVLYSAVAKSGGKKDQGDSPFWLDSLASVSLGGNVAGQGTIL